MVALHNKKRELRLRRADASSASRPPDRLRPAYNYKEILCVSASFTASRSSCWRSPSSWWCGSNSTSANPVDPSQTILDLGAVRHQLHPHGHAQLHAGPHGAQMYFDAAPTARARASRPSSCWAPWDSSAPRVLHGVLQLQRLELQPQPMVHAPRARHREQPQRDRQRPAFCLVGSRGGSSRIARHHCPKPPPG